MKKLFLFICLILPLSNVIAETTYSPYGNYLYSEEEIISDDLTEVEKIKKYKFYQELNDYSDDYYKINEQPEYYKYQSVETINSDYSPWSTTYPQEQVDRVIESKAITYYKTYLNVRSVELFVTKNLNISEMNFYVNNAEIKINLYCTTCGNVDISKINDNNTSEVVTIPDGANIHIDLIFYQQPDLLSFDLNLGSDTNTTSFQLGLRTDSFATQFQYLLNFDEVVTKNKYSYKLSNIMNNPGLRTTVFTTGQNIDDNKIYFIIKKEYQYRYYDIKHKYYNVVREYAEGYYFNKENYIKDETSFIEIYKYRIRNKIINNYIEKEKLITKYVNKTIKVPELKYKTQYIPLKTETVVKKNIIKEDNDVSKYGIYAVIGLILKKISFFR